MRKYIMYTVLYDIIYINTKYMYISFVDTLEFKIKGDKSETLFKYYLADLFALCQLCLIGIPHKAFTIALCGIISNFLHKLCVVFH